MFASFVYALCAGSTLPIRIHRACVRMTRAREFHEWLHDADCRQRQRAKIFLANGVMAVTIIGHAYTNVVFAFKFDR